MPRIKYLVEQIIHKLREAEVPSGQDQTVKDLLSKNLVESRGRY